MNAAPAWKVATHRSHTPPGGVTLFDVLPAFEFLDEALQSGADYPGLLDWEGGVGLFSRSGRAMHAGGTPGVAVEGDAQFDDDDDPEASRADYLQEAGANPDLYDLSAPNYFLAWTFFATK